MLAGPVASRPTCSRDAAGSSRLGREQRQRWYAHPRKRNGLRGEQEAMKKQTRTASKQQDARTVMLTGEQLAATRGGAGGVIIVQNLTPGNGGVIIVQN